MYQINFNTPVSVHFIGIGGISMSGLAFVLMDAGFRVSGSDAKESELTDKLTAAGASIRYPQAADNIPADTDVVVYTAAIHPDNPEYAAAVSRGIPMLTRAELLGEVMRNYKVPVAVAGTHGKTTTTSMLSMMALSGLLDPTISVGGILEPIGGNIRVGGPDVFIAEACEYTNSFLSLLPKVAIILNIDADHLDFFKDLDDIRHSFRRFAELLPEDGTLIINAQIPDYQEITDGLKCKVITYGTEDSNYHAANVTYNELGFGSFDLYHDGVLVDRFDLMVPGSHNVLNACASIAASQILGMDKECMKKGLLSFTGTDRRFQKKGTFQGATVIDDYAHHPTEIRATLTAARNYPHKKVWCVFQPHTYTRTKSLMDEFGTALALADHMVLADIYAARETDTLGISSQTLQAKILENGTPCEYFDSFEKIENYFRENVQEGDLLITMGAGDVYKIGEDLVKA